MSTNNHPSIDEAADLFTIESCKLQDVINHALKKSEILSISEIIEVYYQVINVTSITKFLTQKFGDLETDQQSGIAPPPLQKPYPEDAALIDLIGPDDFSLDNVPLAQAIGNRKSHRNFTDSALSLEELSFLLACRVRLVDQRLSQWIEKCQHLFG